MDEESVMNGMKLLDICLTGNYYFFGGLIGASVINKIIPEIDEKEANDTPTGILIRDIVLNITLILVVTYLLYTFIPQIKDQFSPFDGVMGFQHIRMQWTTASILLGLVMTTLQPGLKLRILALASRL